MPSTLSQFRARIAQVLIDTANANYSTGLLEESLRSALHDYSEAYPLTMDTAITLPGDGREIALNNVSGLLEVTDVWWPYDTTATEETWPPNRVRGFRVYWDDARPVLFLEDIEGDQPQLDDELRLWYTKLHTIQDLDSGDSTTIRPHHESRIARGAAAYAALSRASDRRDAEFNLNPKNPINLQEWGEAERVHFLAWLRTLRARTHSGPPFHGQKAWKLDKWDSN